MSRRERMTEWLLEDEGLTNDLDDRRAKVLIAWATDQAGLAADDAARSDETVAETVRAIRKAVRRTAAQGAELPLDALVALAVVELQRLQVGTEAVVPPPTAPEIRLLMPPAPLAAAEPALVPAPLPPANAPVAREPAGDANQS